MSDSEQPTATEQPEEQPVADTQAPETEEQPTGTGEDTAETPAEQPQPDEPIVADEGEPGPSDEEPKPAEEGVEEPKPAEEGVEDQAAPAVEETEQPEAEAEPEPEVKEEVSCSCTMTSWRANKLQIISLETCYSICIDVSSGISTYMCTCRHINNC